MHSVVLADSFLAAAQPLKDPSAGQSKQNNRAGKPTMGSSVDASRDVEFVQVSPNVKRCSPPRIQARASSPRAARMSTS